MLIAAVASLVWFFASLIRAVRAPSTSDLFEQIVESADVTDDYRGLLLLKALDEQNVYRVLTYWDVVWKAYLLPHADIRSIDLADESPLGPLATYAAAKFGLENGQVSVHYLEGFSFASRKFSSVHREFKSYTFETILVVLRHEAESMFDEDFIVGGRRYKWQTIDGLNEDSGTVESNGDVLRFLEEHFTELFVRVPDTIPSGARIRLAPSGS